MIGGTLRRAAGNNEPSARVQQYMTSSIGPHRDAQGHPGDPFRGVSRVELPQRSLSPREQALAETTVPPWRDICTHRIRGRLPTPCSWQQRGFVCLTRMVTGLLIVPTLFAFGLVAGGVVGSLMATQFAGACLFVALGFPLWHLLAGLLRWTVSGQTA